MDEVAVGDATMADVLDSPGESAAVDFDTFVAAAAPRLLRTAFLLAADRDAAEDLLQETLMRAWAGWRRVRLADRPEAYVHRMLVNTSVSRWRSLRRRVTAERLVASPPERPGPAAPEHDDTLWKLLRDLPPRQRAVMVLLYYEDLGEADVGALLGCTAGTVKSQRAKALRTLRARIGEEEDR